MDFQLTCIRAWKVGAGVNVQQSRFHFEAIKLCAVEKYDKS